MTTQQHRERLRKTFAARGVWPLGALNSRNALMTAALVLTLVLAVCLRFYGLNWDRGQAFTPHPDERAILMKVGELSLPTLGDLGSLLNAEESPWNPRWFPYGSFPLYLLKGVQIAYGVLPGPDLGDLRTVGRTISALADTATVLMVYMLGRRLFGLREGLLAAALVATSVLHIQLSHFFAVDTIMALSAVVALYFLYGVAIEGRPRDSVLAGVVIGLGIATKVSIAPIYIAFAMAHVMFATGALPGSSREGRPAERLSKIITGGVLGGAASLAAFAIAQPYALLDFSRFYTDTIEQSEMVRRIRDYPYTRQYIDTTAYLYQIRQLATWGFGLPLGIVAWAGLLYASLRGLRLIYGVAYLAIGWILPMGLLLFSNSILVILLASGVAFAALAGTLPFRRADTRGSVLLLSWVIPYFLITGSFQVKFIRYLLPISPFLVLFGSRMLIDAWDGLKYRVPASRTVLGGVLARLLGGTGFYAISYMSIYGESHTAVRTAQWLNSNAAPGATILKEHWEEGLPNLEAFRVRELPLYNDDDERKLQSLAEELSAADYLVFFSNRLYGTLPRLHERYPLSGEYYRQLFTGGLGYELVNVETSYPSLAGVTFTEDTFGRPGVPVPELVKDKAPSGFRLDLGFADESFTVYDHPMGLVFANEGLFSEEVLKKTIRGEISPSTPASSETQVEYGLMLSPENAETQQAGGTWSEIVNPGGWSSNHPTLTWLLLIEGISLLILPLTLVLFRPLADRGYLFSKGMGLLGVGLGAWLLTSLHWMTFARESVLLAMVILCVLSLSVAAPRGRTLIRFVRSHWRILLVEEALFLAAFFAFVAVRMANPDLWHPHLGGEKPMDMAYLNAVLKSSYMPPYDPWFGGGFINYYYWGQFLVAMLIHVTGIDPAIAFNLAVPMFFALAVVGAFTIVYNLAEATRMGQPKPLGRRGPPTMVAGIIGAAFVMVIGNLDGALQVIQGIVRVWLLNMPFGSFDFWRSTRMMPPDPPGHEITEFPFFTFLFGDLHAHLMAIPFTMLVLGLALAVVLGAREAREMTTWTRWRPGEVARLIMLGVVVGSLRLINTWDYPTYLLVAAGAIFLATYLRNGGINMAVFLVSGMKIALVIGLGYVIFLPFHLHYETFFSSLEGTTNQTVLWQFLLIHGLFIFIVGSYFAIESKGLLVALGKALRSAARKSVTDESVGPEDARTRISRGRATILAVVGAFGGLVGITILTNWVGSTIPFAVLLLGLVMLGGIRRASAVDVKAPVIAFAALLTSTALMLVIALDIFRVQGDIERMNSVFKFYLQIWILLALASAYLLWHLVCKYRSLPLTGDKWTRLWVGALIMLVIGSAIYPLLGTQARLRMRFEVLPVTLDGMAYMQSAVYQDANGQIELAHDYNAIRWLQRNIEGSPMILEGLTPNYRWGGRVSTYTGLPAIVGWQWHQQQQRWGYREDVGARARDVDEIFSTTSVPEALSLLDKYGVQYLYVGQLERLYYPAEGFKKFEDGLGGRLEEIYQNSQVTIYELHHQMLDSPLVHQ